ncbi:ABC transporter permease [Aerococcus christensenii]|uniref:ABC transporter permease n=1 Tax=Aerococcus christensenii TaxID=87541 RepID=UPI0023A9FF88|nr:ABC transporter permease [Aerococcus christensenii]MDK8233584.1 ABC transporter permease [Aerococcus christensenii]WEB70622.1 ABC transporter permease [Aerococcus christensenii]
MEVFINALAEGSVWAVMGLGIFISFRILNAPDMTTEGSFTLGAGLGGQAMCFGFHPVVALGIAFLAGMAAGAITGLLTTRLKLNPLLSGIITMTGLYSINLKMMGAANLSLSGQKTFKTLLAALHLPRNVDTLMIGLVVTLILIALMSAFFKTEMGQALIATGDNRQMAKSLGIDAQGMEMLGYMLANGIIACSGVLVANSYGYADISMGIGTVVIGLASIIIGEVLLRNVSLPMRLVTILLGSVFYRLLLSGVLLLKFEANDFKLFSAIIVGFCLSIPTLRYHLNLNKIHVKKED